jgi:hypothetical protein
VTKKLRPVPGSTGRVDGLDHFGPPLSSFECSQVASHGAKGQIQDQGTFRVQVPSASRKAVNAGIPFF